MIYKKIATELKARINSDDHAVGDMLPSEKDAGCGAAGLVMITVKRWRYRGGKADRLAARQRNLHCAATIMAES